MIPPMKADINVTVNCPRCGNTMYREYGAVTSTKFDIYLYCSNNDCPIAYRVFKSEIPISVMLFDQKRLIIAEPSEDIDFDEGWTAKSVWEEG